MTARARFTLDTNLLVYAVDRDAGERHDRAVDLLTRAAQRDCLLSVQVLGEFFHATTRKSLLPPAQAAAFVHNWIEVFDLMVADPDALVQAMDAVAEHRMSFWDAMLWATARAAGCAAILSEDMQHGRRLSGVEIISPFAADASERLASLLGD